MHFSYASAWCVADLHVLPQDALLSLMANRARAANGTAGKGGRVRTFDNGFVIEEMAQGPPSGKLAKPGKKVWLRPDHHQNANVLVLGVAARALRHD